jgi:exopolysaccharide biosynthesis protein
MTAAELTRFLAQYFAPYSALNLDGGGSSTLWVGGFPFNGIVNYPTDNKRRDHYGQRRIKTALVVVTR